MAIESVAGLAGTGLAGWSGTSTRTESTSAADYDYLRQLVMEHSRNVLDSSRDYLFETRLARLLRARGLTNIEELVQLLRLRRDSQLEHAVAEAMTINETSFFRDNRPFELLRTELLPKLIEARMRTRRLRFWSAACSTGQEAYSLAMLIREHFPMLSGWQLTIEGTDLSTDVVARAQSGRYPRIEINRGLPARHIVKYFDHAGEDWTVKPELQQMCRFRQANLCAPALPFTESFDVVMLRNVMLYFNQETRKRLLAQVHKLLPSDGILFLGSSEQPADLSLWHSTLAGGTSYYRPRQS